MARSGTLTKSTIEAPLLEGVEVERIDIVTVERNIANSGLFSAGLTENMYTRRFTRVVTRDNVPVELTCEFIGSKEYGLPTTADLEKFLAFCKIAQYQRGAEGKIRNPIRFTGRQMMAILDQTVSGKNYEAIKTWGMRMLGTSISSELIYVAGGKRIKGRATNIFRSFDRDSDQATDKREDTFVVTVEDWVLENLNGAHVLLADFNKFKMLNRNTAKALFAHLYTWFYAMDGKPFTKDYGDLCRLLNIKIHSQLSRAKGNLKPAMEELIEIGYLSEWDIQPRKLSDGFKVTMWAGKGIMRFIKGAHKQLKSPQTLLLEAKASEKAVVTQGTQLISKKEEEGELSAEQEAARAAMIELGVTPEQVATNYAREYPAQHILNLARWVSETKAKSRGRLHSPAGLFVKYLKDGISVPVDFIATEPAAAEKSSQAEQQEQADRAAFEIWKSRQISNHITRTHSQEEISAKLLEIAAEMRRSNPQFARIPEAFQTEAAMQVLMAEIEPDMAFPRFSEWKEKHIQFDLF